MMVGLESTLKSTLAAGRYCRNNSMAQLTANIPGGKCRISQTITEKLIFPPSYTSSVKERRTGTRGPVVILASSALLHSGRVASKHIKESPVLYIYI